MRPMIMNLITAPASEPVTTTEAKSQLRLETALDDAFIVTLITAARMWVEQYLWRALITQTWEVTVTDFPADKDYIELPKGNVQSITSVTYLEPVAGVATVLAAANYELSAGRVPTRLHLKYGFTWPSIRGERWNGVAIRYVAGYGEAAAVPAPIKQAILMLVSHLYEQRSPEVTGTIVSKVEFAVTALLSPYKLRRF